MHFYEDDHLMANQSKSLGLSVGLHILILILMCFNFSWSTDEFEKSPPAILMVDLTKVKIDEKTNLPPLVKEVKKEDPKPQEVKKEEKKVEPKKEDKTPLVKKVEPAPKVEPQKPKEAAPKKEAVKVQEKKPEPKKEVKKEPKKEVKKETPKPQPQPKVAPKPVPKKQAQGLQSLLASVEKVRKPANAAPTKSVSENTGETVNKGIAGGTEGSLMSDLTISEKDLIANKIRSCWNVNAGVQDADKMIIEVRAFINKDGSVRDVKILNMKQDPIFRSMAESAKRAIYVCDAKGEESPFRILAQKRPEMYNSWKQIYLRMNPVDGGVY